MRKIASMDAAFLLLERKVGLILSVFRKNREKTFYLREIARMAGVSPATTLRIVRRMVKKGIVEERKVSKFKFYVLSEKAAKEGRK